jgi:hypothetical protein
MNLSLDVDDALCTYDPDDNPGGLLCRLEEGWELLHQAAKVWDLLGSDRGERLREELDPGEEPVSYAAPSQLQRLAELLDGVVAAAEGPLVDENWRLHPDLRERVEKEAPGLGEATTDAEGRPIHTLARTLSSLEMAGRFLADALRLGCFVIIE